MIRQGRRLLSTSRSVLPPSPPVQGIAKLNRSVISVSGPETFKFLNGLATNLIDGDSSGLYCGFLNGKGRLMADSFAYLDYSSSAAEGTPRMYLECDSSYAKQMMTNLKMYKLRAKVQIEPVEDLSVWSVWDDSKGASLFDPSLVKSTDLSELVGLNDCRAGTGFALRLVLRGQDTPEGILTDSFLKDAAVATQDQYDIRRYVNGVAEGIQELIPAKSLPLESNLDFMGGVDFNKGCYVGQELTIRSYHHGTIRKRIVPLVLANEESLEGAELFYDPEWSAQHLSLPESLQVNIVDVSNTVAELESSSAAPSPFGEGSGRKKLVRPSGTLLRSIGNVGLGLVRLEHFALPEAQFSIGNGVLVKAFQPYWWNVEEES